MRMPENAFRAWPWLIGALITTAIVAVLHPQQLGVLVWSLSKLSIGAYLGYWIDRTIFYYARPDVVPDDQAPMAWLRRAIVMSAVVIALGLGV